MPRRKTLTTCVFSLMLNSSLVHADKTLAGSAEEPEGLWNMSLEELGQVRVISTATGTATPLDKAAAVATVITEEDILAIGATDLDEVLETVPGLHVTRHFQTHSARYIFRGITSTYNPHVVLLINGVPSTDLAFGGRGNALGGMPVKSIARIEIIRGPGSALYGADAYAGVINIITKRGKDIDGTSASVRTGSFDTHAAALQHGWRSDDMELGFTLETGSSQGHENLIIADSQTLLDKVYGTQVSLAPGPYNAGRKWLESRVDIAHADFRLRAGYQGRYDVETGAGTGQALDPYGRFGSEKFNIDLTHTQNNWLDNWSFSNQVNFFRSILETEKDLVLFPAGTYGGAFPDGVRGSLGYRADTLRYQFSPLYTGFDDHLIRWGAGFNWGDIYQTKQTSNYSPTLIPRPNGVENIADTPEVWLPEKDRSSYFMFIQDEWQFTSNWQLTSGLRYDHYSDFGETLNPRLALIWATTDTLTTKWLYGRAFRAPAMVELYATSNPVALGDPTLSPETVDTYELALSHSPVQALQYNVNLYFYQIRDFINFVPIGTGAYQARNKGQIDGHGSEFDITYQIMPAWKLLGNYAWQRTENKQTHAPVGSAPDHSLYARSEWKFRPGWRLDTQGNWIGEQKRGEADPRPALDSYATLDITLRSLQLVKGLDIALSARNLFDAGVFEPSDGLQLPGDIPMPGRSLYGELTYTF